MYVIGGSEGGRTPVQKQTHLDVYMLSSNDKCR